MSDHLTEQSARAYARGQLEDAGIVACDEHLASCDSCRDLADVTTTAQRVHLLDAVTSDRFDRHLAYDRMAAACDAATLTTEESRHLEECADCGDLVTELSAVRDEIAVRTDPGRVLPFARQQQRARWMPLSLVASLVLLVSALLVWSAGRQRNAVGNAASRRVAPQRQVTTTVRPAAIEQLRDGNRVVTFDREGNVSGLPAASAATISTLQQLFIGSLPVGPVAQLNSRPGVMLGASGEPAIAVLVAPVGTVVRDQRPTFRWRLGDDAGMPVSIGVYDREFNRVAGSAKTTGSKWKCSTSLRRGEVYRWQITIHYGGREVVVPSPPSPEARFKVLSEQELREIDRVEQLEATSHLMAGAAYLNAGLLDDAERELRALADANPGSAVASRLLASLRRAREPQLPLPITTKAAQ